MKNEWLIIKILLIIVILLYGVKVVSEVDRSTDGAEYYQLQQEILHYKALKGDLKEQLGIAKSLHHIDFVARNEMGMVDAKFIDL